MPTRRKEWFVLKGKSRKTTLQTLLPPILFKPIDISQNDSVNNAFLQTDDVTEYPKILNEFLDELVISIKK